MWQPALGLCLFTANRLGRAANSALEIRVTDSDGEPAPRQAAGNGCPCRPCCCTAAIAPQAEGVSGNNLSEIKYVDTRYAILTCLDAVSMVPAAFEGGGIISINRSIV